MTGERILVVDDELSIRRLLRNGLEHAGYDVVEAVDARAALDVVARAPPAAVLLDLGLPDRDGLELIPLIARLHIPILVISARDATDQKVAALDLGAEDYVTKPFDAEELRARLRAALRARRDAPAQEIVTARGLTIDLAGRIVTRDGAEVHLTRKEYDVLAVLAAAPGRVVTHQRVLAAAWPYEHDRRIEYLRIVVRNLRQKLEEPGANPSVIANELGVGYRLMADG